MPTRLSTPHAAPTPYGPRRRRRPVPASQPQRAKVAEARDSYRYDLAGRCHAALAPEALRARLAAARDTQVASHGRASRLAAASLRGVGYGAAALAASAPVTRAVDAVLGTGGPLPAVTRADPLHGVRFVLVQAAALLGAALKAVVFILPCLIGMAVGLATNDVMPASSSEFAAALYRRDEASACEALAADPARAFTLIDGEPALAAALRSRHMQGVALLILEHLQGQLAVDPTREPEFAAAIRASTSLLAARPQSAARDSVLALLAAASISVAAAAGRGALAPSFVSEIKRCAHDVAPAAAAFALADRILAHTMVAPPPTSRRYAQALVFALVFAARQGVTLTPDMVGRVHRIGDAVRARLRSPSPDAPEQVELAQRLLPLTECDEACEQVLQVLREAFDGRTAARAL